MVEATLRDVKATRDSDIALTIEIWKRYFPTKIQSLGSMMECVNLKDLYDLPREDNVKRIRANIQNVKKLYLPTSWEVAKQRKIEENEWRTAMGYPTIESTGTGKPDYKPKSLRKVDKFV